MIKRLVIVILFLLVLFGGVFGWKYLQIQKMIKSASAPRPPATVSSVAVTQEQWQPQLHSVGNLVANQGVAVTTEVSGIVAKLNFESGQTVKQGDLLVQLDDSVDRAELNGLIAQRNLADLQYKRNTRLFKQKSVSQSDLDIARANLDNATAQVEAQRARLQKKALVAPFTGMLGIRQVDLGEYLAPGKAIVTLQALDPVFADFSLPERYLAKLRVDQPVSIRVQAYPDKVFSGHISAISSRIQQTTRQVDVRAILANPDLQLRPGMFAEVTVLLPEQETVLTLPEYAITYNPYGSSVFLIEKKDQGLVVQRKQVTTGEVRKGRVAVLKGLQAGDQVVSVGQVKLRNGEPVQIDNSVKLTGEVGE